LTLGVRLLRIPIDNREDYLYNISH
jgi:hypothetical protein